MTPKRRAAILARLKAGYRIRRYWAGSRGHGYLSHILEGIKNLRESEVQILKGEGLLELDREHSIGNFQPYKLVNAPEEPLEAES